MKDVVARRGQDKAQAGDHDVAGEGGRAKSGPAHGCHQGDGLHEAQFPGQKQRAQTGCRTRGGAHGDDQTHRFFAFAKGNDHKSEQNGNRVKKPVNQDMVGIEQNIAGAGKHGIFLCGNCADAVHKRFRQAAPIRLTRGRIWRPFSRPPGGYFLC